MTVSAPTLAPYASAQHLVLDGVSWDFYERVLAEVGDRPIRVTFDRGRIEIMSPLPEHENLKTPTARLIEMMCFERRVSLFGLGSTTFRDEAEQRGLEPDECFTSRTPQPRARYRVDSIRRFTPPPTWRSRST